MDSIKQKFYAEIHPLFLLIIVLVFTAQTGILPIAKGNTWVYSYTKNAHCVVYSAPAFTYDTIVNGEFNISIDSALILNDSAFFTMTVIDSGMTTTTRIVYYAESSNTVYNNRLSTEYLMVNNTFYKKDSSGAWASYNAWYLSYVVLPDSEYTYNYPVVWQYQPSTSYKRHSDSTNVIINIDSYTLCQTEESNTWAYRTAGNRIDDFSSFDTIKWVENIGGVSRVHRESYYNVYQPGSEVSTESKNENWTLVTFNGNPLTITGVRPSLTAKIELNIDHGFKKILWLGNRQPLLKNNNSPYYNIRGQKISRINPRQLLINKK